MKKLKIERPDWSIFTDGLGRDLDKWFDKDVEPINKMLESAVEVYAYGLSGDKRFSWSSTRGKKDDSKALLINVEPIKQETCADVLRDIKSQLGRQVQWSETECDLFYERAKKALERENKGDES